MRVSGSGIKFNNVDKALMYSGVDLENKIRGIKSVTITDGKIKGFVKEYQDKKSKVEQMRPRQFIGLVNWNLKAINKDKDRDSIYLAVDDIATKQMLKEGKLKESKHGKFLMFFHKLGQFFQGHGFRRESKYIRSLANKIEPVMGIVVKSAEKVDAAANQTRVKGKDERVRGSKRTKAPKKMKRSGQVDTKAPQKKKRSEQVDTKAAKTLEKNLIEELKIWMNSRSFENSKKIFDAIKNGNEIEGDHFLIKKRKLKAVEPVLNEAVKLLELGKKFGQISENGNWGYLFERVVSNVDKTRRDLIAEMIEDLKEAVESAPLFQEDKTAFLIGFEALKKVLSKQAK